MTTETGPVRSIVDRAIARWKRRSPPSDTDNPRLDEDLGLDSLDFVQVVMMIEVELGITLPDQQTAKIATIEELALLCDAVLGGTLSPAQQAGQQFNT